MKVCAKIGGEPWAIDELPFFNLSSMAASYFVDSDQISLVGSINQKATRYWSKSLPLTMLDTADEDTINFKFKD